MLYRRGISRGKNVAVTMSRNRICMQPMRHLAYTQESSSFFSYWGWKGGCVQGWDLNFFLLTSCSQVWNVFFRMFPSSHCVAQGCSQKHPKGGGKGSVTKHASILGREAYLAPMSGSAPCSKNISGRSIK